MAHPSNDELDYSSFVQRSRSRLSAEIGTHDLAPNDLALTLNRASGWVTRLAESRVHRPRGLSWSAFKVLFILWMIGDLEQHRVALLADTSRATTSAIVKSLTKSGLVVQSPLASDKRTNVLTLTHSGRDMARQAYLDQNELLRNWSSILTPAEQEILTLLLSKLILGTSEANPAD